MIINDTIKLIAISIQLWFKAFSSDFHEIRPFRRQLTIPFDRIDPTLYTFPYLHFNTLTNT